MKHRPLPSTPDTSIYSEMSTINGVYSTACPPSECDWNGVCNMAFNPFYGGSVASYDGDKYATGSRSGRPVSDQRVTATHKQSLPKTSESLPTYNNQMAPFIPGMRPESHFDRFESSTFVNSNDANPNNTNPNNANPNNTNPNNANPNNTNPNNTNPNNTNPNNTNPNNTSTVSHAGKGDLHSPQSNIGGLYAPKLVKKPSSIGSYI